jgi:O-acetylhomoserine (thiol)-lyase
MKWHEAVEVLDDLGSSAYLLKARMTWMRDLGACISPFNSFLLIQGVETLPLRMERHCENAAAVAEYLSQHNKVKHVKYPKFFCGREKEIVDENFETGYGPIVFFELHGGLKAGKSFIQNLNLLYHVANVGDARSLATHPASTTHTTVPEDKRMGIFSGSVRLCVGIESIDDILNDIEQALAVI